MLYDIFNAAAQGQVALMLDLDWATVVRKPGVHDPVEPDLVLEAQLQTLMEAGCPVSINTGRPEKFIENLFPNIYADAGSLLWNATETGARITNPDKTLLSCHAVPGLPDLKARFNAEMAGYKGAFIEGFKTCSMTLSLAAAEDKRGAFSHMVRIAREVAEVTPSINIIDVYKDTDAYIEVVPAGINKGTAAELILNQPAFAGKTVVSFGDSVADEAMMVVANDRGGYSVGVGERAPDIAHFKVPGYMHSQAIITDMALLATGRITVEQALEKYQQDTFVKHKLALG